MAEQYVRFVEVDERRRVRTDGKLVEVARVSMERELAYEVRCEVGQKEGRTGMLYVRGMDVPGHGLSLVGLFRPMEKGRRVWEGKVSI